MNIALIGYGKMGKAIEQIAIERGHFIVLKIDLHNQDELTIENLQKANVAIEFTGPDSAIPNLKHCLEAGIPVVCGSTGWLDHENEIINICSQQNGSLIYASNFSVGVNIFFELNKKLAKIMKDHAEYNIRIDETHHTQKKDAPSGTAISIADGILENIPTKNKWVKEESFASTDIPIFSHRIDPEPGIHTVKYYSPVDDIEITHKAHNRTGFATGAVLAAEYIYNKKGIFTMKDVLGL